MSTVLSRMAYQARDEDRARSLAQQFDAANQTRRRGDVTPPSRDRSLRGKSRIRARKGARRA